MLTSSVLSPRRTPEAYLRAEVASFPLCHMEAFSSVLTDLDPDLVAEGPTARLWQACEKSLVEQASGWSLDRIVACRDRFWFDEKWARGTPYPLHEFLRRLAESHLHRRTGTTRVRQGPDTDQLDAISSYRWLTFALPEDLLLAALGIDPAPTRVELEPPLLVRRLRDLGVAEVHQHIGAGMDFPLLWASAMATLAANPKLDEGRFVDSGFPFDSGGERLGWLLAAACARCVLAEALWRNNSLRNLLAELLGSPSWTSAQKRTLAGLVEALGSGEATLLPGTLALKDLFEELHPAGLEMRFSGYPDSLEKFWRVADPVAVRLQLKAPNAGEHWLVHNSLRYLDDCAKGDRLFECIFWQTVRVRVLFYRALVQRPMTAGLQWFVRFNARIGALRAALDRVSPEVNFEIAGAGEGIAAIELRTCPKYAAAEVAAWLQELLRSWNHVLEKVGSNGSGGREPEFGLVFHFAKSRDRADRAWAESRPRAFWRKTLAEPGALEGRYADYWQDQIAGSDGLCQLLRAVPSALWLVRGLDVASDELAVPTWVFVPLFHRLRTVAAFASASPLAEGAPALRTTAHVGEDFRHLLEGLRRIFETSHYLLTIEGSRLGHATALGYEPRLWAESVGAVMMPAEERLWDLVFEWRLYTGFRIFPEERAEAPPGRLERVANLIHQLGNDIFGQMNTSPTVLAEAHHFLHLFLVPPVADQQLDLIPDYPRALARLRPDQVQEYSSVFAVLKAHLLKSEVFVKGQRVVEVGLDESEVAALYSVQNAMRRMAGFRGLVVEVNPSSNLLIGDLLDLRNHPILRLFPPEAEPGAPPPVPIVVGSDDPLTFSTHLLREYALLYETARSAGFSDRVAQSWLESIRATGMDARFTLPWRPSARARIETLVAELGAFLDQPASMRRVCPAV